MADYERSLLASLSKKGWRVAENLFVERAYADGHPERLPGLAHGLARQGLDLIITGGAQTTIAAARATETIPIVFTGALWPVEQGLVDSLGRPGRNVTGHVFMAGTDYSTKRLQVLREIAPAAKRLSWVWPEFLFSAETVAGGRVDLAGLFEAAAREVGFETRFHLMSRGQDIESLFEQVASWRAEAMTAAGLAWAPKRIADSSLRHRLPSIFDIREIVEAGGLMSYGPVDTDIAALGAEYVNRVLRGARPSELPIEQPSRYELAVNKKTAKALGIALPRSLLLRTDTVVE
jgi:putative ABC transport system substrate-binding protein